MWGYLAAISPNMAACVSGSARGGAGSSSWVNPQTRLPRACIAWWVRSAERPPPRKVPMSRRRTRRNHDAEELAALVADARRFGYGHQCVRQLRQQPTGQVPSEVTELALSPVAERYYRP